MFFEYFIIKCFILYINDLYLNIPIPLFSHILSYIFFYFYVTFIIHRVLSLSGDSTIIS